MIDFKEETKVYNAKIKFSWLGIDEDGVLKYQLGFDYEKGSILTAKIAVNNCEHIKNILNTLDLHYWEEVARKFSRIRVCGKQIVAFGNLIENRWVEIL